MSLKEIIISAQEFVKTINDEKRQEIAVNIIKQITLPVFIEECTLPFSTHMMNNSQIKLYSSFGDLRHKIDTNIIYFLTNITIPFTNNHFREYLKINFSEYNDIRNRSDVYVGNVFEIKYAFDDDFRFRYYQFLLYSILK